MSELKTTSEVSLHSLAELYARWALNFLVEVAHGVSYDFVVRPQNYRHVSTEVGSILNDFRFKLGSQPDWPDTFQRALNFRVLSQINVVSPSLREAAILWWENRDDNHREQLVDGFRDAVTTVRSHIEPIAGQALSMINKQTQPLFDRAVKVFQDPQVAKAFGLSPAPTEGWPLGGNFSGEAAYLIAEMLREFRQVCCLAGLYKRINAPERPLMPQVTLVIPHDKFINLQKAAYYGSQTISRLLSSHDDVIIPDLMNDAYRWTKALQQLVPDVPRAWKYLDYRSRLTDLEWGMAPNPSGDTTPVLTGGLSAQTYSVSGEICCSTGDLECDRDPTSRLSDHCSEFHFCAAMA